MAVVINGTYATEVQPTTIAAAQLPGLVLQYNASGILAPATTRVDALLMSEILPQTSTGTSSTRMLISVPTLRLAKQAPSPRVSVGTPLLAFS